MTVTGDDITVTDELRVENQNLRQFDAKLRFALLASLRSAIFIEINPRG